MLDITNSDEKKQPQQPQDKSPTKKESTKSNSSSGLHYLLQVYELSLLDGKKYTEGNTQHGPALTRLDLLEMKSQLGKLSLCESQMGSTTRGRYLKLCEQVDNHPLLPFN